MLSSFCCIHFEHLERQVFTCSTTCCNWTSSSILFSNLSGFTISPNCWSTIYIASWDFPSWILFAFSIICLYCLSTVCRVYNLYLFRIYSIPLNYFAFSCFRQGFYCCCAVAVGFAWFELLKGFFIFQIIKIKTC